MQALIILMNLSLLISFIQFTSHAKKENLNQTIDKSSQIYRGCRESRTDLVTIIFNKPLHGSGEYIVVAIDLDYIRPRAFLYQ